MCIKKLINNLSHEYPYILLFHCNRKSSKDGNYDYPMLFKTIKDAHDFSNLLCQNKNHEFKINLPLNDIQKDKFPLTIVETIYFGITESIIIDNTKKSHLMYLFPKKGETKYVGIFLDKCNGLWCPSPKSLNNCYEIIKNKKFGPIILESEYFTLMEDDSENHLRLNENNSDHYFSAIVGRQIK